MNVAVNAEANPFPGPHIPYPIPNSLIGLIIGKNGDTIKQLHNKCGAYVFIPKQIEWRQNERILELSGTEEQIERAKREIQKILNNAPYYKN
jgi:far upstream element-binding protein